MNDELIGQLERMVAARAKWRAVITRESITRETDEACDALTRAEHSLDAAALLARLRELEAIVAKLPRLADGLPFVPGMELWEVCGASVRHWSEVLILDKQAGLIARGGFTTIGEASRCYSTQALAEEAAAAARTKGNSR